MNPLAKSLVLSGILVILNFFLVSCQPLLLVTGEKGLVLHITAPVSPRALSPAGAIRSIDPSATSVTVKIFQGTQLLQTGSSPLALVSGRLTGSVTIQGLPVNTLLTYEATTTNGGTVLDNIRGPCIVGSATASQSLPITFNKPDLTLASLTVFPAAGLNPYFSPSIANYSLSGSSVPSSISLTPTLSDSGSSLKVSLNGGAELAVGSGNAIVGLNPLTGTNTLVLTVSNPAGESAVYRVVINPPGSSLDLAGLESSNGTFSPAFSPSVTTYNMAVSGTVSVGLRPFLADISSTVAVQFNNTNIIPVVSGNGLNGVNIDIGPTAVHYIVTNQVGQTKTYTVNIVQSGLKITGSNFTFGNNSGTTALALVGPVSFTLTSTNLTIENVTHQVGSIPNVFTEYYTGVRANGYNVQFTGGNPATINFLRSEIPHWTRGNLGDAGVDILRVSKLLGVSFNYYTQLAFLPDDPSLYTSMTASVSQAGGYSQDANNYPVLPQSVTLGVDTVNNLATGTINDQRTIAGQPQNGAANFSGGTLTIQYYP